MEIKFNSDEDLPLNKQLKFFSLTIIVVRTVFEEDCQYLPQIFLDECFLDKFIKHKQSSYF